MRTLLLFRLDVACFDFDVWLLEEDKFVVCVDFAWTKFMINVASDSSRTDDDLC